MSDNEFHFSYDFGGYKEFIEKLQHFKYDGIMYRIVSAVEGFDIAGYHSFMIYAEQE